MLKKIENNFTLIIGIFFLVLAILPFLAPIFAHLGLNFLSDPIYWIYQWLCHQRPARSYHIFDYQVADCARNNFIYLGLAFSALTIHFKKIKPLRKRTAIFIALLSILPLALDGTIQLIAELTATSNYGIPSYESTNLIRSLVGAILGIGVGLACLPFLKTIEGNSNLKEILKYYLIIFLVCLGIIPLIVLLWNGTSNKYKPSSMFVDNAQRFPGYNYEIVGRAGHSTIHPAIEEPLEIYIQRAKKYNRQDLLNEYYKDIENKK